MWRTIGLPSRSARSRRAEFLRARNAARRCSVLTQTCGARSWRCGSCACSTVPTPSRVNGTRFSDVDDNHPWAAHIERLAELEVTRGHIDGTYRPDDAVTRAQLASFLVRAFDLPAVADDYSAGFEDTDGEDINRLAAAGLTNGCGDGNFCPERATSRAEVAVFLVRAMKWRAAQAGSGIATATWGCGSIWFHRDDTGRHVISPKSGRSIQHRSGQHRQQEWRLRQRRRRHFNSAVRGRYTGHGGHRFDADGDRLLRQRHRPHLELDPHCAASGRIARRLASPCRCGPGHQQSGPGAGQLLDRLQSVRHRWRTTGTAPLRTSTSPGRSCSSTTPHTMCSGRDATPGPVNIPLTRVSS